MNTKATPMRSRTLGALTAGLGALALALTSCAADDPATSGSPGSPSSSSAPSSANAPTVNAGERLAVSVKGKVHVLDAATLTTVGSFDSEDFTRVNATGDGTTALVTTSKGFQLLDLATPRLTEVTFPAEKAGHVVRHHGKTVLFADGTGTTTVLDTASLAGAAASGEAPHTRQFTADAPHHGVSIELTDGSLATTVGTSETRTGARVVDAQGKETASNQTCPGVHGEGTAKNEVVVFGCQDGALLYKDGAFTKLQAPDAYGRTGNSYVAEDSSLVIGDYQNDQDAEGVGLHAIALIDTEKNSYKPVHFADGIEYTWRGLARTDDGAARLLSTDGKLRTLDPATGRLDDGVQVVKAWKAPIDWQEAHPALAIRGNTAYVTEPATSQIHAIDLTTNKVTASADLDGAPLELAIG